MNMKKPENPDRPEKNLQTYYALLPNIEKISAYLEHAIYDLPEESALRLVHDVEWIINYHQESPFHVRKQVIKMPLKKNF